MRPPIYRLRAYRKFLEGLSPREIAGVITPSVKVVFNGGPDLVAFDGGTAKMVYFRRHPGQKFTTKQLAMMRHNLSAGVSIQVAYADGGLEAVIKGDL